MAAAVVVLGVLSALGLFLVGQGEYHTADDTMTLDGHGNPEIVTLSCRAKGIGRVVLVRASDGAIVFTAALRQGATPRANVSVDEKADGDYEKVLPLGPLDPNAVYVPAHLEDEKGAGIGAGEQAFRPVDLRPGLANGGYTHDGKRIDPTPLEQWRADTQARFRGC